MTSLVAGSVSGSGTPTFSRASAAYVPDYEGVMRSTLANEARFWGARRVYNGLTYSQDFANAAWTAGNLTGPPSGAYSDPMGGTAAQMLQEETSGTPQYHNIYQDASQMPVSGRRYVTSIYAKNGSGRGLQLQVVNSSTGTDGAYIVVDLTNGSIFAPATALGAATTAAGYVETLADGWYRINVSVTWAAGTTGNVRASATLYNIGAVLNFYPGTAGYCYIFGAQCEDATGSANFGLPEEYVAANVAASPYYGCGVDAVKCFDTSPQMVANALPLSELIYNWTKTDITGVLTATPAPLGGGFATSVTEGVAGTSRIRQFSVPNIVPNFPTSFSICVKAVANVQWVELLLENSAAANNGGAAWFDIVNGVTGAVSTLGAGFGVTSSIVNLGGGWFRCTLNAGQQVESIFRTTAYSTTGNGVTTRSNNAQYLLAAAQVRPFVSMYDDTFVVNNAASASGVIVGPTATGVSVPIPAASLFGCCLEVAATQLVTPTASIRLVSDASWVKVGAPTIATTYGIDGVAGACNQVTSTAGNTTILQTLVAAASSRAFSVFIKRITGTGNIELTQDGAAWTNIAGLLVAGQWVRVSLTASQLNASFGVRIVTSGDSIAMDFMQFEAVGATSPMPTAGASRVADSPFYTMAGNLVPALGSAYLEFSHRYGVIVANSPYLVVNGGGGGYPAYCNGTSGFGASDLTNFGGNSGGVIALNTDYKGASAWDGGGTVRYIRNGGVIVAPACVPAGMGAGSTVLRLGTTGVTGFSACVRNVKSFGVKLTDPQLTAMVA